jgi:hypothetical protein
MGRPAAAIAPTMPSDRLLHDHTQAGQVTVALSVGAGNAYMADDFVVPDGGWTVGQVLLTGRLSTPGLALSIVPDNGGVPGGALPAAALTPTFSAQSPCCNDADTRDHLFTLPAPVQLQAGRYWLVARVTVEGVTAFQAHAGYDVAGSPARSQVDGLPGWGDVRASNGNVDVSFALFASVPGPQYTFSGFAAPVDNDRPNAAKAGRAIPLRWRLTEAGGAPVTTLATATVTVESLACEKGSSADPVEEYAPGESGLQHLGNGYYQLNWKSPTSYAKSCKTLKLHLGNAGGSHAAAFQFTK